MIIGLPKEIKDNEYRVGLTPAGVRALSDANHKVLVEKTAGEGSGFDDELYRRAGGTIVESADDVWADGEMIVKVKEPIAPEYPRMREGQLLFTYLHLAPDNPLTEQLLQRKVTGVAYETITDRRGTLPLLTPMSEVAGRMAIQVGAHYLEKMSGGRGILLGGVPGVPAARVVIIGGGVVGTNAAKIAVGMGAHVTIIDNNLDRLRELDDIFLSKISTLASSAYMIHDAVSQADLIIGAVLVPGAAAPRLVTRIETMQSVSREQSIKAAAAQRDAAKARADAAQAQLSYSRIVSPIDGVVTDRPIYAGEMPPSGGPIITVMDVSQVIARAHVSQGDAKELKVGNAANIVPADGSAMVPGKVTVISPAVDPTSTTVEVWVQSANPGGRLKPGTSVRVEMVARTVQSALVIPQGAVLTSPSGSTSVIVVGSDNKPEKKNVTLGIRDAGNVEVTEGLESGERVVTTGAYELSKLEEDVLAKTKLEIQVPKEEEDEK